MRGQLFKFGIILKNWTLNVVSCVKAGDVLVRLGMKCGGASQGAAAVTGAKVRGSTMVLGSSGSPGRFFK